MLKVEGTFIYKQNLYRLSIVIRLSVICYFTLFFHHPQYREVFYFNYEKYRYASCYFRDNLIIFEYSKIVLKINILNYNYYDYFII